MELSLEAIAGQQFTADWFSRHIPVWEQMKHELPDRKRFLELGSFEGRSACWMLENMIDSDGHLFCVDTWKGSPEFIVLPPGVVENSFERFQKNIALSRHDEQRVFTLRNTTVYAMAKLIAERYFASFDFIYVDAAHQARETLTDAVLAWPLLKTHGVMVFDDYTWSLDKPADYRPKCGIDAFVQLFHMELETLGVGEQYIVRKTV